MARAIAYKCKTPGCDTWLEKAGVPDDTLKRVTVPLRIGEPLKITCPTCKREHEYAPKEKQLVEILD